ncbi:MAG: hypothetical protein CME84_15600 [Henriciella sp.]|uniref:hypothetical protein n=1 Tax=Hyphococcus sp. TaxID=2038636 RepID=UPI000C6855F7|nr:hypothetical protein [Henriciella sp.]QYJ00616.1 hypothetical protein KUV46_14975 [Thalassovita mediterranea]
MIDLPERVQAVLLANKAFDADRIRGHERSGVKSVILPRWDRKTLNSVANVSALSARSAI